MLRTWALITSEDLNTLFNNDQTLLKQYFDTVKYGTYPEILKANFLDFGSENNFPDLVRTIVHYPWIISAGCLRGSHKVLREYHRIHSSTVEVDQVFIFRNVRMHSAGSGLFRRRCCIQDSTVTRRQCAGRGYVVRSLQYRPRHCLLAGIILLSEMRSGSPFSIRLDEWDLRLI